MLKALRALIESYVGVLILSVFVGLFLPQALGLSGWSTVCLQMIFFLSSLKIDLREVQKYAADWRMIVLSNLVMLVGLPLLVYVVAQPLLPEYAFPLFLLAAMPVGMTTPLLVEVIGGSGALALVVTVSSSLLAPFTIPLLIRGLYSSQVSVDVFGVFRSLILVIVIPFFCALFVKRIVPAMVRRANERTKPISILLLGILIAGAVAKQAGAIKEFALSGWSTVVAVVVLFVFFGVLHLVGYYAIWWKSKAERRTLAVCLTYMNFTLAIYLATTFFPRPEILLPLVVSILPWATLLPVWKRVAHRLP